MEITQSPTMHFAFQMKYSLLFFVSKRALQVKFYALARSDNGEPQTEFEWIYAKVDSKHNLKKTKKDTAELNCINVSLSQYAVAFSFCLFFFICFKSIFNKMIFTISCFSAILKWWKRNREHFPSANIQTHDDDDENYGAGENR